jgi:hypothetical protein
MGLLILQRRHEHGDPANAHPLENLNISAEKHASKGFCREIIGFII